MQVKVCTKCGIEKPLSEFWKHKECRLGVNSACKKCKSIQKGIYYRNNREKCEKASKDYRENNKEKCRAYHKDYRKKNKKKRGILANVWFKNQRKTNPKFKLNVNISSAIYKSLKGNKNGKHWENIIGYTLNNLKQHLERLFTNGMTWDNYGEWVIDHKMPISVFNFTRPEHEDFKKCWSLSNLQPLWAEDNLKKWAKLDKHFQPSLLL